jgi:hypothetical protein
MTTVTESLIEKIDNEIEKEHDKNNYGTVDIWNLVQYLALDIIGKTAFGQAFNMIENNRHFVPAAIGEEMRSSTISVMYPILSKLFIKDADKTNPKLTKVTATRYPSRKKKTC